MSDSALREIQQRAGGVFVEEGSQAPLAAHFGDPRAEYAAARGEAALFDLSDRTQVELSGRDRAKFLHNFCTNEIKLLQPGQGCEAFVTNVKGRVLGHVFVFAAPESLWIESVAGAEDALVAHLDRYLIAEDVTIHRRTAECGELFVSGPRAAERLESAGVAAAGAAPREHKPGLPRASAPATREPGLPQASDPATLDALPRYGHAKIEGLEHPLFVRRVDLLGAMGYLLSVPRESLGDLWNRLAGAGISPAGAAAFHALRIEAGMPLYGIDISDDNLAQEVARTKQAISFTKGCYLGQEPIARVDALGHVNRELRGVKLASGPLPSAGDPVVGEDGKQVGHVTSSAVSPADDLPVALAYLRTKFTEPGTVVTVQAQGEAVPATVFVPAE